MSHSSPVRTLLYFRNRTNSKILLNRVPCSLFPWGCMYGVAGVDHVSLRLSYPSTPIARSPRLASRDFSSPSPTTRSSPPRRPHPLMAAARRWRRRRWQPVGPASAAAVDRRGIPSSPPRPPPQWRASSTPPSLPPPVAVAAAGRRRRRRSPAPPSSSGTPRCGHLLLSPSCRCSGRLWNAVEEVLPCLLPNWGMLGRKPFLGRLVFEQMRIGDLAILWSHLVLGFRYCAYCKLCTS